MDESHTERNRRKAGRKILKLKAKYIANTDNPVNSMDTKKKENIGNFYRDGRLYT